MRQLEIWLTRAPFSDMVSDKVRPMLVLSSNYYNNKYQDFIGMYITTNLDHEYSIEISKNDLDSGELFDSSAVRCDTISRVEKTLAIKKLGKVKTDFYKKVINKFDELIKRQN